MLSRTMFIQVYFIGVYLMVAYGDVDSSRTFSNVGNVMKLNPKIKENREELKRIIRVLNGHLGDRSSEEVVDDDAANQLQDRDEIQVENQVSQFKRLLGLLQKKYDHQIRYSKLLESSQPRIYYIENPEVIEEFKNVLRTKDTSTSSSSDVSDFDRNLGEDDSSNYRREAIFEQIKLDSSENVNALRNNPIDDDDRASRFSGQTLEWGPRNRDDYPSIQSKGRYKISRNKRVDLIDNNKKKRKKTLKKPNYISKKKKHSGDRIETVEENRYIEKENGPRKQPRETPGGRLKINRDPAKFSDGERWGGGNKFKPPIEHIVRRPNKQKDIRPSSRRNSKPYGRTFIPFIAKKTVYEED